MNAKNIDLGMDREAVGAMSMSDVPKPPEKVYPRFHFEGPDSLEDLGVPREGTMTVRYCIVRSTETKDEDGNEHYSCETEIREILSAKPDAGAPAKDYHSDTENALDALAAEHDDSEE